MRSGLPDVMASISRLIFCALVRRRESLLNRVVQPEPCGEPVHRCDGARHC
jgi:hypothetical protein